MTDAIQTEQLLISLFAETAMLDDRTACCPIALFDSISSSFFGSNWLLQQFRLQWRLVYPTFNTPVQQRRPVVLQRYRFFENWQSDKHPHPSGTAQSFRHDSRTSWRNNALQLSFHIGSVMPTGQTSATEDGRSHVYLAIDTKQRLSSASACRFRLQFNCLRKLRY